MSDAPANDWIEVAVIGRPHGILGELRAHLHHTQSNLLLEIKQVRLRQGDSERTVGVISARKNNDVTLLRLDGINDRDQAEGARGALISVRRSEFPTPDEGEFYLCDLLGAIVFDETGAPFGEVIDFASYPTVESLVVLRAAGQGTCEIPLIDDLVASVNSTQKRVDLRTREGLDTPGAQSEKLHEGE